MHSAGASETSANFYHTTGSHIP